MELAEKVMEAESLNYREKRMVSAHLGFCMECYATHYYDKSDLDEGATRKGNSYRRKPLLILL